MQKGVLYFSIDGGRSWRTVDTPGSTVLVNGYQPWSLTPKLYRTTWFRWSYAGDMLTAPAATSPRHPVIVTVAPPITVTVARSGANRTVHGLARRSGGRIVLLHKVGPRFRLVATASISSKGAFSFGRRHLASGRYEVVAVGDASWGASTKVFTI